MKGVKPRNFPISYKTQRETLNAEGAIRKTVRKRRGEPSPRQHRSTPRTHGTDHPLTPVQAAPPPSLPGRLLPPPLPRFKIKLRNPFLCLAGAAVP
jgi:hypothetical protein